MPCMDYGDQSRTTYRASSTETALRERNDMLARIACRAMELIEGSENAELKAEVLADTETAKWWKLHAAADRLARERREKELAKKAEIETAKASAFAKMTDEEIKAFGLKRPAPPKPKAETAKRGRPKKTTEVQPYL